MAVSTVDPAPAPASVGPGGHLLATVARLGAAATGGLLLYASFPPRTLWWLALPAFALLAVALHSCRARAGAGLGAVFGAAFFLPLLVWIGDPVGPVPWLGLVVLQTAFVALTGAGMAMVSRLPAVGVPLGGAAVWVAGEALRGRVPFGGLPWGRVGFGQADGPLLPLAALGGVPLLSFVTVLAGLALGEAARRTIAGTRRPAAVAAVTAGLAVLAGPVAALVPPTPGPEGPADPPLTVAAVQGNVPRLGLDFNAQRRAVLDNHARVTEELAADVAAGRATQPDVVLWPENASDIDPLRNPDAAARIDDAAAAVGAPIVLGTVLRTGEGRTTTNSVLVWEAGTGVVDRTDKRQIQPFGEYLPWREFFSLFSAHADRAGFFVPGEGNGTVDAAGARLGVVICWEVAFDGQVADTIAAGAGVLTVPSNNATFGLTEMSHQQLAMSRVRAVEHDRPVQVVTTSGVSATIDPDGTVTDETGMFVPGVLHDRVEPATTTTLATRLRSGPEWALTTVGVLAIGWVVGRAWYRQRTGGPESTPTGEGQNG